MKPDEVLRAYNYNIKASLVTGSPVSTLHVEYTCIMYMFSNYLREGGAIFPNCPSTMFNEWECWLTVKLALMQGISGVISESVKI